MAFGISNTLFDNLKAKVNCMDKNERNCVLLFDEMRIKKALILMKIDKN